MSRGEHPARSSSCRPRLKQPTSMLPLRTRESRAASCASVSVTQFRGSDDKQRDRRNNMDDACSRTMDAEQGGCVTRLRRGFVWVVVGLLVFTLVATLLLEGTA